MPRSGRSNDRDASPRSSACRTGASSWAPSWDRIPSRSSAPMRCSSREQPLTPTASPALAPDRVRLVLLVIVLAGLGLAVWLRLAPIFADFAFGDGGLFWVMAKDLRNNGFLPPDVTTYNTGDIPWVYPPIGIYL